MTPTCPDCGERLSVFKTGEPHGYYCLCGAIFYAKRYADKLKQLAKITKNK